MTISSSLNAGVAGLNANASRLATISDNIANSSTYGYKRAETDFHALVNGSSSTKYSAGGVRTSSARLIEYRCSTDGTGVHSPTAAADRCRCWLLASDQTSTRCPTVRIRSPVGAPDTMIQEGVTWLRSRPLTASCRSRS